MTNKQYPIVFDERKDVVNGKPLVTPDRYRVLLFLIAFSARLILPASGFPAQVSDSGTYLSAARGMIGGTGFVDEQGRPTAFRPPTYPIFLAGMLAISGGRLIGVQIIQAFLAALIAPLLYELVVARLGRARAFLAGLIFAVDPVSVPSSAYVLTECIGSILIVLWVSAWRRSLWSGRPASYAFAGLLGGGMVYQTMIALLLHPLALLYHAVFQRGRLKLILLSALIFVLPLAGWTLRNRLVMGESTAVRSGGFGFLLWATMNYDFPWLLSPYDHRGDYIFRQEQNVQHHYDPSVTHSLYARKAIQRILAEPVECAKRVVKASFWAWVEVPGAMKTLDSRPVIRWGLRIANLAILVLAGLGARSAARTLEGRIALGVIVYFAIFHAALFPIPRYFIPVRPLLALVASFAFMSASSRARPLPV